MNQRQRVQLEMSRRTYEKIPTKDMAAKVTELENVINSKLNIWDDEEQYKRFQLIYKLNLSDRRLLLVYSILDGSIAKTATYFNVNRRTIQNNLERIQGVLGL